MAVRRGGLRIGQMNLGRSRLASDELRRVAAEESLDVLLIQEPYSNKGEVPGFGLINKVVVGQGVPMAAVVVCRRNWTWWLWTVYVTAIVWWWKWRGREWGE